MSVFLDYLKEAYNETGIRSDLVEVYILPMFKHLIVAHKWTDEDILDELVHNIVEEYFISNFTRCDLCQEWTREEHLYPARYDLSQQVCQSCREDGN